MTWYINSVDLNDDVSRIDLVDWLDLDDTHRDDSDNIHDVPLIKSTWVAWRWFRWYSDDIDRVDWNEMDKLRG